MKYEIKDGKIIKTIKENKIVGFYRNLKENIIDYFVEKRFKRLDKKLDKFVFNVEGDLNINFYLDEKSEQSNFGDLINSLNDYSNEEMNQQSNEEDYEKYVISDSIEFIEDNENVYLLMPQKCTDYILEIRKKKVLIKKDGKLMYEINKRVKKIKSLLNGVLTLEKLLK